MGKKDRGKVVHVEAYSGYRGDERPLAFESGGERISVRRILERRRTPEFDEFRVQAEDGAIHMLAWERAHDVWRLR